MKLGFRHIFCLCTALLFIVASGTAQARTAAAETGRTEPAQLADMLIAKDAGVRARAVDAVKECGMDFLPGLTAELNSGPAQRRRGAVIGLALLPVPDMTVAPLIHALGDEDVIVRSLAAHALGKAGHIAAEPVAWLLSHSDDRVRVGAALALNKMGEAAVPALTAMITLKDPMVTAKAAWLLGVMGPKAMAAVPTLVRALETDDMRLVHLLAETIDIIGPNPAMLQYELTMLGEDRIACPATQVGAAAAPTLVKLLGRPGTPMAYVALYSLARMGAVAKPALKAVLATGNQNQKTAAALLLTDIDPKLAHTIPEELREALSGAMQTH